MFRSVFVAIALSAILSAADHTVTLSASKAHNKVHRNRGIEYAHGASNDEEGFVEVNVRDTIAWTCPSTVCRAATLTIFLHGFACSPFVYTDAFTIKCTVIKPTGGQDCTYNAMKRACIKYDIGLTAPDGTVFADDPEIIIDNEVILQGRKTQRIRARAK